MSFSKEKRENIKRDILDRILERQDKIVQRTVDAFGITSNTVYRYLRELTNDGIIEKIGKSYQLVSSEVFHMFLIEEITNYSEDVVFFKYIEPHVQTLPKNVYMIWYYAFTEMMNNVIDHSEGKHVVVFLKKDFVNTSIIISDDGVGIFNKIKSHYGFFTLEDAILELFKGKLTTDTKNHSGEGIFFTSRIMDIFAAISDEKVFSHTEYDEILQDLKNLPEYDTPIIFISGTTILMKLANDSNKSIENIMNQYADVDGGFTRTRIPLKNIYPTYPVSRSQAKRLTHRFESFQEIELDFDGISEVGQGFAHELFVVFQNQHKNIKLIHFNANISVQRMINHVTHD